MEVLSQFPALETVHFAQGVSWGSMEDFFASLAIARRQDDQRWRIKDIKFPMDNELHPALDDLNLPLETLSVSRIWRSETVMQLRRILAAYAPKLLDLSLEGSDFSCYPEIEILSLLNNDVFDNVTNLNLIYLSLQSVTFLLSFPKLKKLNLYKIRPTSQFALELMDNWVISSCVELAMELTMDDLKTEDVRQLLGKLPNLEILMVLNSNNDMFQVICELLPKLVNLELRHGWVDDTGISGLDKDDVARINEEGMSGWPITVARPNLTGLKNLKRFRMCGSTILPGYTTALCVQQLPQLQQFSIPAYRRSKVVSREMFINMSSLHSVPPPPQSKIYVDLQTRFPWTCQ